MSSRIPLFGRPSALPKPQLGTPVLTILIESDATGLMQTRVTGNNPSVMQVVTLLVDCLKGYMDTVNKQASMIINPSKDESKVNGGKAQENHDSGGGNTSGIGNP